MFFSSLTPTNPNPYRIRSGSFFRICGNDTHMLNHMFSAIPIADSPETPPPSIIEQRSIPYHLTTCLILAMSVIETFLSILRFVFHAHSSVGFAYHNYASLIPQALFWHWTLVVIFAKVSSYPNSPLLPLNSFFIFCCLFVGFLHGSN